MFAQSPPHLLYQVGEVSGGENFKTAAFWQPAYFLSTAQTITHLKSYLF